MSAIVLCSSTKEGGDTFRSVQQAIAGQKEIPVVHLAQLNITPYDYTHANQGDDFLPLVERMVAYERIILASPVHWYTMNVTMKIFLDRLTDLLEIRTDLKDKLIGKQLFVIGSCNTSIPEHFDAPFRQTAVYMGMQYAGCAIFYWGDNVSCKAQAAGAAAAVQRFLAEHP